MTYSAWPWARAALTAEDRAEITRAEPRGGRCVIGRDGRAGGVFRATITDVIPMVVLSGIGRSPIEAFRNALAQVPA